MLFIAGSIFLFIAVILTSLYLIVDGSSKSVIILKLLWLGGICFAALLIIIGYTINFFTSKMTVERDDVYGWYVIDRSKFPGAQADWQYEHYRFEITKTDSIKFYVTKRNYIIIVYQGPVDISPDGVIVPMIDYPMGFPKYHVLSQNPTLYRQPFSFYYVFESSLYGNMFFTKGEYKMLE